MAGVVLVLTAVEVGAIALLVAVVIATTLVIEGSGFITTAGVVAVAVVVGVSGVADRQGGENTDATAVGGATAAPVTAIVVTPRHDA
jgi:hypothetical protein